MLIHYLAAPSRGNSSTVLTAAYHVLQDAGLLNAKKFERTPSLTDEQKLGVLIEMRFPEGESALQKRGISFLSKTGLIQKRDVTNPLRRPTSPIDIQRGHFAVGNPDILEILFRVQASAQSVASDSLKTPLCCWSPLTFVDWFLYSAFDVYFDGNKWQSVDRIMASYAVIPPYWARLLSDEDVQVQAHPLTEMGRFQAQTWALSVEDVKKRYAGVSLREDAIVSLMSQMRVDDDVRLGDMGATHASLAYYRGTDTMRCRSLDSESTASPELAAYLGYLHGKECASERLRDSSPGGGVMLPLHVPPTGKAEPPIAENAKSDQRSALPSPFSGVSLREGTRKR